MINDVFTVHTMRPDDIGAVEIVFISEKEARAYARDRSTDFRVLAASVTRFTIGSLGTRHPVAWFIEGREQPSERHGPGTSTPPTAARSCDRCKPGAEDRGEPHVTAASLNYRRWGAPRGAWVRSA